MAEHALWYGMLTHVVRVFQVLHNGDIIADGYVRPLKPQAAKGAEANGTAKAGTEDAPAKGAADKAAAGKVSHHIKNFNSNLMFSTCRLVLWHPSCLKMTPEIRSASCEAHYMMASVTAPERYSGIRECPMTCSPSHVTGHAAGARGGKRGGGDWLP